MYCWNDSSGMPFSTIVTPLLMPSMLSKQGPSMTPLSLRKRKNHKEQEQVNREVVSLRPCFSRRESARCSEHYKHMYCRGETAAICPVATLVLEHWVKPTPQALLVNLLINHLPLRYKHFLLLTWTVLLSSASATSEISTYFSSTYSYSKIQIPLPVITLRSKFLSLLDKRQGQRG